MRVYTNGVNLGLLWTFTCKTNIKVGLWKDIKEKTMTKITHFNG